MIGKSGLFLCCLLFSIYPHQCFYSSRRPIWNLGHMVNGNSQIEDFLNDGANGVEADVTFDQNGGAKFTYHGFPCDCFRKCWKWEIFTQYLRHVHDLTTQGHAKYRPSFVLLILDLKLSGYTSLMKKIMVSDVTHKLIDNLWRKEVALNENRLKVILSFPSSNDIELVHSSYRVIENRGLNHLKSIIGFDVYSFEDLSNIRQKWLDLGVPVNVWQSDGITNCLARSTARLREAISWRDNPQMAFMSKIYYWTVDKRSSIRSTLRLGVDAILTNHPARLSDILKEKEFEFSIRLADLKDDPFNRFDDRLSASYYLMKDQRIEIDEMIENSDPNEEHYTF